MKYIILYDMESSKVGCVLEEIELMGSYQTVYLHH